MLVGGSTTDTLLNARPLMRIVSITLLLILMCACRSVKTVDRQTYERERNKYITVIMDGDVRSHDGDWISIATDRGQGPTTVLAPFSSVVFIEPHQAK